MNWEAIAVVVTALIQLLGIVWLSGRYSQQINDGVEKLKEHDKSLEIQRGRLDGHDVELAKLAAWHQGYNAGAKSVPI